MFLVKFGAEWCGPCQKFDPVLADLADQGVEVFDVDVDDTDPAILAQWNVSGIPATFIMDENGEIDSKYVGAQTPKTLVEALHV